MRAVRACLLSASVSVLMPSLPPSALQLSPEVTDLLNKIFVVDEKKRITIDDIKKHAWYNEPLPEKYARALDRIHERQREVEEYIRQRDLNIVRAQFAFPSS
jgi:serine/threonine-protein kinase SRK2